MHHKRLGTTDLGASVFGKTFRRKGLDFVQMDYKERSYKFWLYSCWVYCTETGADPASNVKGTAISVIFSSQVS